MIDENKYEIVPSEHDNFPLRMRRYSEAARFMMHWHGHTELLYFIKGGASVYVGGDEFLTADGDLLIVNSNELHRGDYRKTGVEYLCIMLPEHFFEWPGGGRYIFEKRIRGDEKVEKFFFQIFEAFEEKADGYRYNALGTAYELVSYLSRRYAQSIMEVNEYEERNSRLENFNNVIDYIGKHYAEPLTTPMAADMAHLSECYFCHMFKKHMGVSFTAYLNEVRIQKALALLDNSRLNVTEVAAGVGFNDVNYFSRVFKRIVGISPRKYRDK